MEDADGFPYRDELMALTNRGEDEAKA